MSNQPPVTLSSGTPTGTLANGDTISVSSGFAVYNSYTAGFDPSFTNSGTIISTTNNGNNPSDTAVFLVAGDATDKTEFSNSSTGYVSGYAYGVRISAGTGTTSNNAMVVNYGTIIETQSIRGNGAPAAVAFGQGSNNQGLTGTILNHGLILGARAGIYLKSFYKDSVDVVTNFAGGTITGTGLVGLEINGFDGNGNAYQDTAVVTNAGVINDGVILLVKTGSATLTNAGTITTIATGAHAGDAIFSQNTGLLNLDPGQSLGGGIASFGSGSTLELSGAPGQAGTLANPGSYIGFTTLSVAPGADWTIGSTGVTTNLTSFQSISDSGTLNLLGTVSTSTDINLTSNGAGGVGILNVAAGSQLIDSGANVNAGGAYVNAVYANLLGATTATTIQNAGSIISQDGQGAGIKIRGTTLSAGGDGATVSNSSSGYIAGDRYGIDFETQGSTGNGRTASSDSVINAGTIEGGLTTAGGFRSGIVFGKGTSGTVTNSGLINGNTGFGVYFKTLGGGKDAVTNASTGTIESAAGVASVEINQSPASNANTLGQAGSVYNAGFIQHGVYLNQVINGTVTNAGTIGTLGGTGTLANAAIVDTNQGVLDLDPGQSLLGGIATFGAGSTLELSGTPGQVGTLANPGSYFGFTTLSVATGADWSLGAAGGTATFNGVTNVSNFGTLNIGGSIASVSGGVTSSTSIDMEGSLGGASVVDFTGSNTSNALYDFGANDQIIFAPLTDAGPGSSLSDSYNTATGVLTVTETNASGVVVGFDTVTVAGTAPLNSASFVELEGPGGATVALASTQLTNAGSLFIDYGEQVTLTNTTGVDTIPVTFGSHGTSLGLNVLDIDGTVAGTNSPYTGAISGFGLNDDIVIGTAVLPSLASGDQVSLSYAGSLLSVAELDAAGATIGSTTINVGTGYAANAFVALLGTNGINIETPATVDETPLTFNSTGTASFEDPTKYSGGLAPGSSIVAGETVIVASGTASIASTSPVGNSGTIIVAGAAGLIDAAPLTGLGTVILSGGGTLTLANTSGTTTNTISFGAASAGSPNVLNLDGTGTASFGGVIAGMGANDTIDLGGSFLPTPGSASNLGLSFNTTTDVLTISDTVGGTVYTDTLQFSGTVPGTFAANVVDGNIVITDVPCFAAGTRILTPNGQVAVEALAEGDDVLTARDGTTRKIIWAGRRTIELSRHAKPEKVTPVIILAGAFGEGLPERDLKLSPDHALFIKGHLIEAKTLVNGTTIIRDTASRFVTYHHIELDRHDVVLAEGLEAETYLDSGNRRNFETDAAPLMLHPDFAATARDGACAALLVDGDIVREIRQELLNRAAGLGFSRTDAIDLVVKTGFERVSAQSGDAGELSFILPAGARSIALISATGVPAELSADPSDRRVLGVAVTSLALIAGGRRVEIDLNDPAHTGFHAAEPGHRWTNGNAQIDLPAYQGRAVLEVTLRGQATRWANANQQRRQAI